MIVLDASALIDVVTDRAPRDWVLTQIDGDEVASPAHQVAEVLSALTRLERADDLTKSEGRAALDEALALPQDVHALTPTLVRRAHDLRERVRVLDGLYVALAESLGADLVTTDARLARAQLPCGVRTPQG